jgi:hypothetical protein
MPYTGFVSNGIRFRCFNQFRQTVAEYDGVPPQALATAQLNFASVNQNLTIDTMRFEYLDVKVGAILVI